MSDELLDEFFYVQDARNLVGNCMLWWARGGGYTCDVAKAAVFTKHELPDRPTDMAWPKAYVDLRVTSHMDMQRCDRKHGLPGGKRAAGI